MTNHSISQLQIINGAQLSWMIVALILATNIFTIKCASSVWMNEQTFLESFNDGFVNDAHSESSLTNQTLRSYNKKRSVSQYRPELASSSGSSNSYFASISPIRLPSTAFDGSTPDFYSKPFKRHSSSDGQLSAFHRSIPSKMGSAMAAATAPGDWAADNGSGVGIWNPTSYPATASSAAGTADPAVQQQQQQMQWTSPMVGSSYGTAQQQQYPSSYGTTAVAAGGAVPAAATPYTGYLEKQINSYPIMIYTLNGCIPCQRAKHLLAVNYPDVRAHFLELSGNEPWQQQLQMELLQMAGVDSFPYIFVCGRYIGGSDDLFSLHESGQLRQMVNQCLNKPAILPK